MISTIKSHLGKEIPMKNNNFCEDCKYEDTNVCDTCDKRKCRVCGCTWNNACSGGCYWVEGDLCSECVDIEKGASEDE